MAKPKPMRARRLVELGLKAKAGKWYDIGEGLPHKATATVNGLAHATRQSSGPLQLGLSSWASPA